MVDDSSQTAPSGQRADEEAIRQVLDHQIAAWAAGDPDAYASVFSPDADYVTFLGVIHKGREAIAASYRPLFKKLLKGTRPETQTTQLRFLAPTVALIHTSYAIVKGGRRRNAGVNTTIATFADGQWLLAASQNTKRRPLTERVMTKVAS